jgi:hypothetical protein
MLENILAEKGIVLPEDLIPNSKPRPLHSIGSTSTLITANSNTAHATLGENPNSNSNSNLILPRRNEEDDEGIKDGDSDTEGAALTLEHLAFGQRKTEQQVQTGGNPFAAITDQIVPVPLPLLPVSSGSGGPGPGGSGAGSGSGSGQGANTAEGGNSLMSQVEEMQQEPLNMTVRMDQLENPAVVVRTRPSDGSSPGRNRNGLGSSSNVLTALDPTEVFSIFYQRSDVYVRALLSVLPDRQRGELLVQQVSRGWPGRVGTMKGGTDDGV